MTSDKFCDSLPYKHTHHQPYRLAKKLHITNGDDLLRRLEGLSLKDDFLVWREMLCEGPTGIALLEPSMIQKRKSFLKKQYGISSDWYEEQFLRQFDNIDATTTYNEIVLWFEFDLFCHINMIAAISTLKTRMPHPLNISLVCSNKSGPDQRLGLAEAKDRELRMCFEQRVPLTEDDLLLATDVWTIYCERDPMKIISKIMQPSSFPYLSSCLRAHVQRFPNMNTGLNVLELNILELVKNHHIRSEEQLLGYVHEYQGYYGYGTLQIRHIIGQLAPFLARTSEQLTLSDQGVQVQRFRKNFYDTMADDSYYGGVRKYDYLYDPDTHKLLKL